LATQTCVHTPVFTLRAMGCRNSSEISSRNSL
jgi:hypothetical protein